jgi:hypothetical protein
MNEKERRKETGEIVPQNVEEAPLLTVGEAQKEQRNSIVLALASLVAIVLLCVAWFVNNSRVSVNNASVQASAEDFELAALGKAGAYDSLLTYETGDAYSENSKMDTDAEDSGTETENENSGTETDGEKDAGRTGTVTSEDKTQIKWVMNETSNMENLSGSDGAIQPGSKGELEFYVIPKSDGPLALTFNLETLLYREEDGKIQAFGDETIETGAETETEKTAETEKTTKIEKTVKPLVEGHILFFQKYGEDGLYDDLIENGEFTIEFQNAKKGEACGPVTIYWVWAYVFGQTMNSNTDIIKPWFSEATSNILYADMKKNPAKYFYAYSLEESLVQKLDKIATSNDDFLAVSEFYNEADEYIGENVQYIVLTLKAKKVEAGTK